MIVYFRYLVIESSTLGVTQNGSIEETWNNHTSICHHWRDLDCDDATWISASPRRFGRSFEYCICNLFTNFYNLFLDCHITRALHALERLV